MDTFSSMMETLMLICFGVSWPVNITKAWRSRTARGTSLLFYALIWVGYVFALAGKLSLIRAKAGLPWYETVPWYVMVFYGLNIAMVSAGILIYFRNRLFDRRTGA